MKHLPDEPVDEAAAEPDSAWVLEPGADETERVLDALGSATTRELLWQLYEAPATPAELAARADCSVQNAHYHLEKLSSASLVQVVATRYSEKGNEMDVYAPTRDPVVIAGDDDRTGRLRALLDGSLAGALAAAFVDAAATPFAASDAPAAPTGPAWTAPSGGGLDPVVIAAAVAAGALAAGAVVAWRTRG